MGVGLAGSQNSVREIRLIRRVGESLGLETESGVFMGKEVPRVELHSGLVCHYFKDTSALPVVYDSSSA